MRVFMSMNLKRFLVLTEGSIAVIFAMSLPAMVAMAGLAVDVSNWYMQRRYLQTAADAASMAGAYEIANSRSQSQASTAAESRAEENNYSPTASGNSLTTTFGTQSGNTTVKVAIHAQVHTWFVNIFGSRTVYADVEATSLVNGSRGPYCFLTLDKTALTP